MILTNNSSRLDHLEGLRGLAAFTVLINHFNSAFLISDIESLFPDWMNWFLHNSPFTGQFAVQTFFVLSGFVLSYQYLKNGNKEYLYKQSVKRFPRLFIPVFITSLIYWIGKSLDLYGNLDVCKLTHGEWFSKFWIQSYSIFKLISMSSYDLFLFNVQSFCFNINSVLWTMPIEFKCSLMIFLFLYFFRSKFALYTLLCISLIFLFLIKEQNLVHLFSFSLGIFACHLHLNNFKVKLPDGGIALFIFAWWIMASFPEGAYFKESVFWNFLEPSSQFYQVRIFIYGITAFFLIIMIDTHDNLKSFFSSRVLLFLGRISFSLYLLHMFFIGTAGAHLFLTLIEYDYTTAYLITLLIVVFLSLVGGWLFYEFVERRVILFCDILYTSLKLVFSRFKATERQ